MTNKPKNSAACRWRSGHAGAVKENTAGAETITDNPWGYNVINKNNIALYKEIEKKNTLQQIQELKSILKSRPSLAI